MPGDWMDELGCCKVCMGEIPEGHTDSCHVWKQDQRITALEAALRKYGEHSTQCNRLGVLNGDCYCGWAHTLDSLDECSTSSDAGE